MLSASSIFQNESLRGEASSFYRVIFGDVALVRKVAAQVFQSDLWRALQNICTSRLGIDATVRRFLTLVKGSIVSVQLAVIRVNHYDLPTFFKRLQGIRTRKYTRWSKNSVD